jgi:large subunit ribosomal protein L18
LIDDASGKTLLSLSSKGDKKKKDSKKTDDAKATGLALAKKAIEKGIRQVVFDRGGYKYHGRTKAFAEGAREGGLEF